MTIEPFVPFSLRCGGKLHTFSKPLVMGILNVTPDSFYDGGRYVDDEALLQRARQIVEEGADIIDIGAASSRPGAQLPAPEEEARRLSHAVALVRQAHPKMLLSVDTCFSLPARRALEAGADIVNDISGGLFDEALLPVVAEAQVPYILMHNVATPDVMQQNARYEDVVKEVCFYFSQRLETLYRMGVADVVIDPGFGFGKTLEHNYILFSHLSELRTLFPSQPLLVALSRKSMIYKPLATTPEGALAGTVALDAQALLLGAQLLRVHDVQAAVQTVQLYTLLQKAALETETVKY